MYPDPKKWNKVTRFAESASNDIETMLDAGDFTNEERLLALETLNIFLLDLIEETRELIAHLEEED